MRILSSIAALVVMLFIAACGNPQSLPQKTVDSGGPGTTVVLPGSTNTLQAALVALSTACGAGQPITWTYGPAATLGANYNPSRDGSVVNGVFTAPLCGSPLLGTKVNVVGSCLNVKTNQNFTTTVVFSIQQEQLAGSTLGAAVVTDCGTTTQCLAANPAAISPNVCFPNQTPFTVQLYTKLDFTCGPVWDPNAPPTNLAACSAAISPGVDGPALCTDYTYSAWGTCSSAGSQTRTVVAGIPAGCVGGATPVLTQACTPPLDGRAIYTQYCNACHGGQYLGAPWQTIKAAINGGIPAMGSTTLRSLTDAQLQAIDAVQ